jgi:SAM-dependent methyltransferase
MPPILPSEMAARVLFAICLALAQRAARTPDIHFTPTRHNVADAMLQLAGVTANDIVYDLGSGDGRIPIIAAQKYGATAIGVEIDPRLVEQSWRNANDAEVAHRVKFIVGDLFETDFSDATVVTMYLSPSIVNELAPKLRSLKPGTRIVSHQFAIRGWPPDERRQVDESELWLWRIAK